MRLCYHKNLRKRRTDADPLIKYLLSQASSAYETGISVIDTKVLSYKTHRASLRQSSLRMSQKPFILCSEMGILTLCMLVSQLIICFLGKHNPNLEALAAYTWNTRTSMRHRQKLCLQEEMYIRERPRTR